MTSSSSVSVIIPAAGIGSRMQVDTPKQYLLIAGKTIIEHSIAAFLDNPDVENIVVCLHKNDTTFSTLGICQHNKIHVVEGGLSRADSVLNGLKYLKQNQINEWVMVHDAARPVLSQKAIHRLLEARNNDDCASGAILAIPAVDTVKLACLKSKKNTVEKTLNRNELWLAQTPQLFKIQHLARALTLALTNGESITDEASAMEYLGESVELIHGEKANLKVTQIEDLALAEFYLTQQQRDNQ